MEKKKAFKFVGAGTLLLALGVWVYKTFKKERTQIVEDQKKIVDEVVEAGGDPVEVVEQVSESVDDSDRNFTKALYVSLNSAGSGFDTDLVDPDKVLDQERIIHLTEDVNDERRYLKLLFEIPEYSQEAGNYNKITFKIITRAIQDAGKYIAAKILGQGDSGKPAWSSTVVVLSYSYLYRETPEGSLMWKERYFEVPRRILEKAYPGGEYTTLKPRAERFYQDIQTPEGKHYLDEVIGADINRMINRDAQKKAEADGDIIVENENALKLGRTYLMHSMGFLLSDENGRIISLSQATDLLSYLVDEHNDEAKRWFVIERRGQNGDIRDDVLDSFRYKGVLFHAPNEEGKFDSLSRHYYMSSTGKVSVCNIGWEYDAEAEKREEKERKAKEVADKARKEAEKAPASKESLELLRLTWNNRPKS